MCHSLLVYFKAYHLIFKCEYQFLKTYCGDSKPWTSEPYISNVLSNAWDNNGRHK
jgi:hypothetical protein